jgi:hypothetical protein
MDLNQYLGNVVNRYSNLFVQARTFQKLEVYWNLKDGVSKEEAQPILDNVLIEVKINIPGILIDFKIIDDVEIVKEEIPYDENI